MEEKIQEYQENIFESIKHIDKNGREYWEARELMKALKYVEWRKFKNVIEKAKIACVSSKQGEDYHFVDIDKMIKLAKGAVRKIEDYKLTRYACYLIVQNGDSRKVEIALGQTYFAVQTRKAELTEEYLKKYENLSEDEKRMRKRKEIKTENYELNQIAKASGVKNFDKFHNAGYKGLYNGETAADIAERKGLRYREDILDNMNNDELIANEFRISLTKQKIKNENIVGEKNATDAHYLVGKAIRSTIKDLGGTIPEELPMPSKSIKDLKKEELRKISGGCICFLEYNINMLTRVCTCDRII